MLAAIIGKILLSLVATVITYLMVAYAFKKSGEDFKARKSTFITIFFVLSFIGAGGVIIDHLLGLLTLLKS